jgi:hypothetical protein
MVRERRVFGRGSLPARWCGPVALGIGAAVVVLVVVLALVVGSAYAGRHGGHRGSCAATRAA